jgi:hypothetical protein
LLVVTGAVAAVAVSLLIAAQVRRWSSLGQCLAIATALQVALWGAGMGLSLRRDGGIGALVREHVQQPHFKNCKRIVFDGEAAHAAQIRVALGNRVNVEAAASAGPVGEGDLLVLDSGGTALRSLSLSSTNRIPCGYRDMSAAAFLKALLSGQLPEFLKRSEREYVIAPPPRQELNRTQTAAADSGPVVR